MKISASDSFQQCKLCQGATESFCQLAEHRLYRCRRCDFHFLGVLDDLAGEEDKQLSSQDRHYLTSRADENAPLHPARLQLLQQLIGPPPQQLLDIGAGIGQFLQRVQAAGYQGRGIEPSALRRQYAREQFQQKLSPQLVEDPYWQQQFAGHFDALTLWDVIEHVNAPRQLLEQAIKLLKPGGTLLLDTPSRRVPAYRLSEMAVTLSRGKMTLFLDSFYSAAPFGHKQIFTPQQLGQLLKELGLTLVYQARSYSDSPQRGKRIILAATQPETAP